MLYLQQLPTLIVGNKHDLVTSTMKRSSPMQYFEMEAIDASALQCTSSVQEKMWVSYSALPSSIGYPTNGKA